MDKGSLIIGRVKESNTYLHICTAPELNLLGPAVLYDRYRQQQPLDQFFQQESFSLLNV